MIYLLFFLQKEPLLPLAMFDITQLFKCGVRPMKSPCKEQNGQDHEIMEISFSNSKVNYKSIDPWPPKLTKLSAKLVATGRK